MIICIDPGHGMSNRKRGIYDPGAEVRVSNVRSVPPVTEAAIVMDWANELRALLRAMGHTVIRTRKDHLDPAPLNERVETAKDYNCEILISLHCNAADKKANGTETFYRGAHNKGLATACNAAVVASLGTRNRGIKLESESQHKTLAVLNFPRAVLIELAFIDHAEDRAKLLDESLMLLACQALADAITG